MGCTCSENGKTIDLDCTKRCCGNLVSVYCEGNRSDDGGTNHLWFYVTSRRKSQISLSPSYLPPWEPEIERPVLFMYIKFYDILFFPHYSRRLNDLQKNCDLLQYRVNFVRKPNMFLPLGGHEHKCNPNYLSERKFVLFYSVIPTKIYHISTSKVAYDRVKIFFLSGGHYLASFC